MGGTFGHVSLGLAFFTIGIWHLFNCIKLHIQHPKSYTTLPWFPLSKIKYFEPISIMTISLLFISSELFIGRKSIPLNGTIPSNYLPHLEHSTISASFFISSLFSVLLDKIVPTTQNGLVHFLQAIAFSQQLLILHFHSTDHMGIEGQYHWLLQIVTFVSLVTTLLAMGYPKSFLNSFVRAFSVVFQGIWLIVMGIMLWTPQLVPKGCFLKSNVVLCHGDRALERAKALVNIQFSWYLIGLTVSSISFYLTMIKLYPQENIEYQPLTKCEEREERRYNVEALEKNKH